MSRQGRCHWGGGICSRSQRRWGSQPNSHTQRSVVSTVKDLRKQHAPHVQTQRSQCGWSRASGECKRSCGRRGSGSQITEGPGEHGQDASLHSACKQESTQRAARGGTRPVCVDLCVFSKDQDGPGLRADHSRPATEARDLWQATAIIPGVTVLEPGSHCVCGQEKADSESICEVDLSTSLHVAFLIATYSDSSTLNASSWSHIRIHCIPFSLKKDETIVTTMIFLLLPQLWLFLLQMPNLKKRKTANKKFYSHGKLQVIFTVRSIWFVPDCIYIKNTHTHNEYV